MSIIDDEKIVDIIAGPEFMTRTKRDEIGKNSILSDFFDYYKQNYIKDKSVKKKSIREKINDLFWGEKPKFYKKLFSENELNEIFKNIFSKYQSINIKSHSKDVGIDFVKKYLLYQKSTINNDIYMEIKILYNDKNEKKYLVIFTDDIMGLFCTSNDIIKN